MTTAPQTMLVAYDGSEESRRALTYAAKLLKASHVDLVTVYESIHRQATRSSASPGVAVVDLTADGKDDPNYAQAVATLKEGAHLADSYGLSCHAHLVETRTAIWSAITDAAKDLKPDVIVLGARQLTGLKGWFSTSTTDSLLHNAGLPLFIIPAGESRPK